jgi:D-alanine-D-alanine ligase
VSRLALGIVFDLYGSAPAQARARDADAEYEPEETVVALEGAIERLGHRSVRLGSPRELLRRIGSGAALGVDAALNIAEGFGTRNREAWAPVLLELAGVPALGSDALTLSASLDKAWAKRLVAAAGVPVAPDAVLASGEDARRAALPARFPLFVKPRWEGASKGIGRSSRVEDREALAREVERIACDYAQPSLVEPFLAGPEYTATVVGHAPPRALAVLQRALELESRIGLHALERRGAPEPAPPGGYRHCVPGELTPALERALQGLALRAFAALECRDWARADFRLTADGTPVFLELNPLPTFARDGSFAILAELEGRALEELLADLVGEGLRRLGLA